MPKKPNHGIFFWEGGGVGPGMWRQGRGAERAEGFSAIVLINVVVVLLFYVHGKHLRSCRDGQLT